MRSIIFFCATLWLAAAVGGMVYLMKYESTPAAENLPYPAIFPAESLIERDTQRPTLLFFAHPKCPCTRASMRELSRLVTSVNGEVQIYVIFIGFKDEDESWTQTDLRASAEAIPNVRVLIDREERETVIFNAQASGLVLLYDREGNLRFNGGITSARGSEGDSVGSQALFEIVAKESDKNAQTPVFGCPLHNKNCSGELTQHAHQ